MSGSRMELLAPAGGMAELKAAVQSGADAVYLGAGSFSARAGANNFSFEELAEAVRYCHMYGVKVHCALNTLIKEKEFEEAIETAKETSRAGVDALIIQDIGLALQLKKILPDMELHASTQMTVTSLEGVRFLEEAGFSRVVLARELSYEEIKEICRGAKAEIEVFVHGAICMCYSGQCLMSSILGGRSGNRGRCAQPCRLRYSLMENGVSEGEAYALSPKDMALAEHLGELEKAGVDSLKIEGRLKSAEYVSAVTGVYRRCLDDIKKCASKDDMTELKNAFSRSGFTDGYFTGKLGRSMMSHENPANNSGNRYTEEARMRASGKIVRKIPINIFASISDGMPVSITAYDDEGNCVTCEGQTSAEKAESKPLERDRMVSQLSKLGQTPFKADDIVVESDSGITVPIREINEVRRRVCAELEGIRAVSKPQTITDYVPQYGKAAKPSEIYLTAEVRTEEQARAVLAAGGIKRLYAPAGVCEAIKDYSGSTEIVMKAVDIFRPEKTVTERIMVSSPAALHYYGKRAAFGDFRLNIYNSFTADVFSGLESITLSPELNLHEIEELTSHFSGADTEVIGYGYLPLMIMRNCPVKAMGHCAHGKNSFLLRDRENMEFRIMCSDGCRAILLNSKPVFTADIIQSIKKSEINAVRLNFTVENSEQCGKIVSVYRDAVKNGTAEGMKENTFTRAHFRRGVL